MRLQSIDLYTHYSVPRQGAEGGTLVCHALEPIEQVNPDRRFPAVLILPGGAYRWTSRRESEPIALRFLSRGYSAFVLHYSCAPSRFPTALRECALAMRYLRENADALHLNPQQIAALGFSAGGHLCGTLGTLYDSREVADLAAGICLRPDALILCYPVAVSHGFTHEESFRNLCGDDAALRSRLSLDSLVRADMPPVFLWHTRDDQSVPVRNSLLLAVALEAANVPFAFHVYRTGPHGVSTADASVFPSDQLPAVSGDVGNWIEGAIGFLSELNLRILDNGEVNQR